MIRSVSEPSLSIAASKKSGASGSRVGQRTIMSILKSKGKPETARGQFLWQGRMRIITLTIMQAPWNMWYQTILLITIVFKYVAYLLIIYCFGYSWKYLTIVNVMMNIGEVIFAIDIIIVILHNFWSIVRLYTRVFRRNYILLAYDVLSLVPFAIMFNQKDFKYVVYFGKWLKIIRIYRVFTFFRQINGTMRTSRKLVFVVEHAVSIALILHMTTCLWFALHAEDAKKSPWLYLGYPDSVNAHILKFDTYKACWYYCACRFFNVIFGDTFPLGAVEKWLTSILMLFGFVVFRYHFIGAFAWELVLDDARRAGFVDRYHHMISYLKLRGAPTSLIEQAKKYKQQLWEMKDGILCSPKLQKLPLPLQMELIFDINVAHFHNSLLFRNTDEAFMRQISLLMKHELYLAEQNIWSQNVVKNGMICIKRGVIEMLSDEDDESPMIAFGEGTVLGELSLFYSIPSKVTVKAATYVELQVLRRTDFMRVADEHPFMLQCMREKIEERLRKSRRRQEAIQYYDKGDSRLIRTRYRPMKVLKDNLAGVEEEDPTFVDDSHMYYRDENNIRQPKFTTEYLDLYELSENVTTVDAPRICLKANFPWILEPNTAFTHMFDIAHFFMVLYLCIMSPHYAIQSDPSDLTMVFSTVVTTGLLVNIFIQLTTAIVEKNVRKDTVRKIAQVKMATVGFYLDILSVFPAYIFTDTLDPQGESVAGQVVKLLPVLQVWHIWDYINKWKKNFDTNIKLMCFIKFFILITIFCYWSGCFLYLFACPRKLCSEKSWMMLLIFWETKVFMTNHAKHERPLVSSFAFGTSIFTGTGTTGIAPGISDLMVVVLIFVVGAYISCVYTARVCSIFFLETQRKLKFKESMAELFYFLTVNHVSSKIKARVKKFFCVQWYYNKAVSPDEIFSDMSTNIQQEVLCIEMMETLLYCPIFQDCNRDFLQTVASNSRTIVLPDNEIVQHGGDIGRDMYILQKGHCNLLNSEGRIKMSIGPGRHFGVIEMLFGLPKVYTVLTTTNCILLHVEYSALVQSWGTFPDISHPIIKVLAEPEMQEKAKDYEIAKPLTGKIDTKINRIAQEIKESFVLLNGRYEREQYMKTYEKLGLMRYIRLLFLPISITPHGIFLKFWCCLRFITAAIYITSIPYSMATKQHKHVASYPFLDIFLYVDIVVMSYVAYYNDKSLLVTHPLLTVQRYFKQSFLLDAISVFPFEELVAIINDNPDKDFYRINRMLLITRIAGAFKYWEGDIMRINLIVVLIKYIPITITLVNIATAFIFMNSCDSYLPSNSYYVLVNCTRSLSYSANRSDRYETKYAMSEYAITFYWVFETFVGCGCTPIVISSNVDMWLCMILEVTGFMYFAFMFGYVSSTRSATAHALLEHTEKTKDLANFLYQENVDPMLTAKTLKYFEYVWKRTNGSNAQQICRRLNSALMEDTLVFMYEKALREVPLFGKVERSFIRVITQHLHEMYFLKGETVVQCFDVQPYIYIIYRGKVDVLTTYSEMITCMGPGGMFGNFSGQPLSCSGVTIYASRSLDLLVIPGQLFFNLIKYYPKIKEPLKKAFEVSKDYILPINMNIADDSSTEDENSELHDDIISIESTADSRTGSTRFDLPGNVALRMTASQSGLSHTTSSAVSVTTFASYTTISNLLRPGTWMYQLFGYSTCLVTTANYVLTLYEIITLNDCLAIFWLQAIFDIYFYVKIYLKMHQGYPSKHGDIVLNSSKCRRRYLNHKFWVWSDIIVNAPLELFGLCFKYQLMAIHYFRANKLLRLKYLIEFYITTAAELINNLTILQAVMTIIVVILLIHTFTCIWLLVLIATSPVCVIRTLKNHLIDEETAQRRWDYATSIYVMISELTATGGDEFVIDQIIPMTVLAICIVCGKMLAAVVVATSIQLANSTKYALTQYETATKELIDMLKNQGLSGYQLKKIWKYVRQLWVTERGRQLPVLLQQIPYVRRCDLMLAMFGHHLRNCYLFADTGENFLRQLAATLEYTIFFPGNYILVAGDCEAKMYWVSSGTVSVVSVRSDLTEITHELLGPGDVFGILQGLNRGVIHGFSYRADTKVSILTLSLDSWINILPYFPEARRIITERSEILFTRI